MNRLIGTSPVGDPRAATAERLSAGQRARLIAPTMCTAASRTICNARSLVGVVSCGCDRVNRTVTFVRRCIVPLLCVSFDFFANTHQPHAHCGRAEIGFSRDLTRRLLEHVPSEN